MSINIQVFEEYGTPDVNGRGTVVEAAHFCMSSSSNVELSYWLAPLRRPNVSYLQANTYTKYLFFKISGTYGLVKNWKVKIEKGSGQADEVQIFTGFTNTYAEPSNDMDGGLVYLPGERTWYPNFGESPILSTSRPIYLNNQTGYSQYLKTQVRANYSEWTDVGNTPKLTLTFSLNEFE